MRLPFAVALVAISLAGCVDNSPSDLPIIGPAPDFTGINGWIGSDPLTLADLEGKVVLVDFWTYSCENCIRTLPHLTAWHAAYAEAGLVIVGVHSPEFEFEKERSNVVAAMDMFGIDYPVAQDNDFATWQAYGNRYWPAKYLSDADGNVRYTHFGEGSYEETETAIRDLLREAGARSLPGRVEGDAGSGIRRGDITPELYAGYWRQPDTIANHDAYQPGQTVVYSSDGTDLQRDRIYLDGSWENREETVRSVGDATAWLKFRSGPVNIVADGTGCIGVTLDGAPITRSHAASDVDFSGDVPCIPLDGPRAYHVYGGPVGTHILGLHAPDGFDLYTYVFSSYDEGGPA